MRLDTPRRVIRAGFDYLPPSRNMPRHQHFDAYVTLVYRGTYDQLSYAGRLKVEAGDVLVQPTYDCHSDHMLSRGVELCRIPWRREAGLGGIYRNCATDHIRRIAQRDAREASALLEEELAGAILIPPPIRDWPDALAIELGSNPRLRIAAWARSRRLSREHVSRGFASIYGASPTRVRSELNARAAWLLITGTSEPLLKIALDLGFADQAHMTRAVKAFTGMPPQRWRTSQSFKTASSKIGSK